MGNSSAKTINPQALNEIISKLSLEELREANHSVGTALVLTRKDAEKRFANHQSRARKICHIRTANALITLKKHYQKEDYLVDIIDNLWPNFLAAQKFCVRLYDTILPALQGSEFFPICVDAWEDKTKRKVKHFFFEHKLGQVPDEVQRAIRECLKINALDCFKKVSEKLHGADLFGFNRDGDTALIMAIKVINEYKAKEIKKCIETVEKAKAESDKAKKAANDLEQFKAEARDWKVACLEFISLLSQAGAVENPRIDCDATCSFGWSALMWAAATGNRECVEVLLNTTADVNFTDRQGRSALYFAAEDGALEILKLLLQHGADRNLVNQFGERPIDRAYSAGMTECVAALGGEELVHPKILAGEDILGSCFSSPSKRSPRIHAEVL